MFATETKSRWPDGPDEMHFAHIAEALPTDERRVWLLPVQEVTQAQAEEMAERAAANGMWVCWCDPEPDLSE